jgi:hypothetical protein
MNNLMQNKWTWVEPTHMLRDQVLDAVTDADLKFTPGGQAMTLGALLREQGEIEYAYLQSFKNFTQDFSYRNTDAGLDGSASRLKAWFGSMDSDMKSTLEAFSDGDLSKTIKRGSGFEVPIEMQLDIYLQALLIFLGKASIYLRTMNKPLPKELQEWVG